MNIREKFFKRGRWYVKLESPFNGFSIIPFANYVWLKGNPSFEQIPKGYVIHHLDSDEQNDDISNLVLMQKHHHTAYHFKQKTIEPELKVKFDPQSITERIFFVPRKEPHIKEYKPGKFRIRFYENLDGEIKRVSLYSWQGVTLETQEVAEKVKNIIWSMKNGVADRLKTENQLGSN